ncbi:MAG TPA: 30S ribosomal protein S18 [Acidimicrobiia bacterium]|jgi:small subunit ribosomal protein S18|nr:30S ribosomal protein S18 [Acidimicrobiia bacterium]
MARSKQQNQRNTRSRRRQDAPGRRVKKKVCYFCTERVEYIDYKDVATLRRYMSDRAKIRSRRVSGNCPRHQREVAVAIKNAREVALLPYLAQR